MILRALLLALTTLTIGATAAVAQLDTAWVRVFDPAEFDFAYAVAMAPNGNITVAGNSADSTANFATITYSPTGDPIWAATYDYVTLFDGPAFEQLVAIRYDSAGNLYLTGSAIALDQAIVTLKYDPTGALLWARSYTQAGYIEIPTDMEVTDSGNVYVAGLSSPANNAPDDWILIKYDSDGDTLWTNRYDGDGSTAVERAYAVELDDSGYVYVTGFQYDTTGATDDWDIVLVKYTPDGDTVWTHILPDTLALKEAPVRMLYDTSGFLYVLAYRAEGTTHIRNLVLKYDLDGNLIWEREYGDFLLFDYSPEVAALGPGGDLFIMGRRDPANATTYLYKIGPDGDSLWLRETNMLGYAMAIDESGDPYVVGQYTPAPETSGQLAVIQYSSNGDSLLSATYADPQGAYVIGTAALLDTMGNLYVTGVMEPDESTDANFITVKFVQAPTDVDDNDPRALPVGYSLKQNYPNPFNPSTAIEFILRQAGQVRLEVFNLVGQLVSTPIHARLSAGTHRITWHAVDNSGAPLASGIYLYRLQTDTFADTRKMVLLR